ncbi:MAG: DUF6711 family protein [Hungatella sp.]
MAFKGYLLKINGSVFPNKYIAKYKATPNQRQDDDSYQDSTGELHREILPHRRSKIEFSTRYLWLEEKIVFQLYFRSRDKLTVEYWNDEVNDYAVGVFYAPDIDYEVYRIQGGNLEYLPIRIALIEY